MGQQVNKTCPWCGGEVEMKPMKELSGWFCAVCEDCTVTSLTVLIKDVTEDEAWEQWNKQERD